MKPLVKIMVPAVLLVMTLTRGHAGVTSQNSWWSKKSVLGALSSKPQHFPSSLHTLKEAPTYFTGEAALTAPGQGASRYSSTHSTEETQLARTTNNLVPSFDTWQSDTAYSVSTALPDERARKAADIAMLQAHPFTFHFCRCVQRAVTPSCHAAFHALAHPSSARPHTPPSTRPHPPMSVLHSLTHPPSN
nr:uncharacterized protein LOC128692510 [Cherax quadricarinatus]